MEAVKNNTRQSSRRIGPEFFDRLWEEGWTYIKTVVDVVREPVLILDKNLNVLMANEPFYKVFKVERTDTENRLLYELGNGQWNIPQLRKLLEDLLPKQSFFKGFEVAHEFPFIGSKVMILNARQIYFKKDVALELFPPIIMLAIEDVTDMMDVAEMLARHARDFETKMEKQTKESEEQIKKLEREIKELKNKS